MSEYNLGLLRDLNKDGMLSEYGRGILIDNLVKEKNEGPPVEEKKEEIQEEEIPPPIKNFKPKKVYKMKPEVYDASSIPPPIKSGGFISKKQSMIRMAIDIMFVVLGVMFIIGVYFVQEYAMAGVGTLMFYIAVTNIMSRKNE